MNCHAAKDAIGRFYFRDVNAVLRLKSCSKRGRPKLGRLLNVQLVQKRLESVTVLRFLSSMLSSLFMRLVFTPDNFNVLDDKCV